MPPTRMVQSRNRPRSNQVRSPTPLCQVWLQIGEFLRKTLLPGKLSRAVGPDQLHAGKIVTTVKPTAPPQIIGIVPLCDGHQDSGTASKHVRNAHAEGKT